MATLNSQEGQSVVRPPFFDRNDFLYRKNRIYYFLKLKGVDLWDIVENGPFFPTRVIVGNQEQKSKSEWSELEKRRVALNDKAIHILFCALSRSEYNKVCMKSTAKKIWDALVVTHEGTNQVKENKMESLIYQYELFKMKSDGTISQMYDRFIEIIGGMKSLGKTFTNEELVKKILRCLPKEWLPKVTSLKDAKDLSKVQLDELLGNLIDYEMTLKREQVEEPSKVKNNIALRVASEDTSEEEEEIMDCPKLKKPNKKFKKKAFKATWDESSDTEEEEVGDEIANMCFMALEKSFDEVTTLDDTTLYDDVVEFSYDELVCALKLMNDELEKSHKKNKILKCELASLKRESKDKLDEILDSQRSSSIKYGLSYDKSTQANSSKTVFVKTTNLNEPKVSSSNGNIPKTSSSNMSIRNALIRKTPIRNAHVCLKSSKIENKWYLDSGYSRHMTGNSSHFISLEKKDGSGQVTFGDNDKGKIVGICKVGKENSPILDKVLLVDGLKYNLLSVSQLCDKGCRVIFEPKSCFVSRISDNKILFVGERVENIYLIDLQAMTNLDMKCFVSISNNSWIWHRRLSHASMDLLKNLSKYELVDGLPKIKYEKDKVCDAYRMGKQVKISFKSINKVITSRPLQLLHMDLFGPTRVASLGGMHYGFIIVDDYSRVLIRPLLNRTPYELWNGKKPRVSYFRVFSCKCFILNNKDN
ncbi:hypothetical protein MANES_14G146816v8 [Manihot esculenta]|uniref:Uncharacterized protein n=1 Tax=Manihot esculenta TaxID=3983 RepID=A0ACB7GGN3_MANES|nr:hypothetical protein MANES_14G146816v8 [Manihot esculenta]